MLINQKTKTLETIKKGKNSINKSKRRSNELINSEMGERREQVKRWFIIGASNMHIARKLGVNEKTIRTDKEAIRNEFSQRFREKVVEDYIFQVMLQTEGIIKQAWKMHRDSANENVRLGALRTVQDAINLYGNLLKQLGLLKEDSIINIYNQQNIEQVNIQTIINALKKKDNGEES